MDRKIMIWKKRLWKLKGEKEIIIKKCNTGKQIP